MGRGQYRHLMTNKASNGVEKSEVPVGRRGGRGIRRTDGRTDVPSDGRSCRGREEEDGGDGSERWPRPPRAQALREADGLHGRFPQPLRPAPDPCPEAPPSAANGEYAAAPKMQILAAIFFLSPVCAFS